MNQPHPLQEEHYQAIDKVLSNVPLALDLAHKCKDCGLPVDDLISTLQGQHAMATKMKQHFFPGRS